MDIPIGILFGILAMLGWGFSDFLAAVAVRKVELLKAFFWTRLIGIIVYVVIFFVFFKIPSLSSSQIWILLLAGALSMLADIMLYKSLQVGKVGIVSPIFNSWPLVTILLGILFLGESLVRFQGFGIILILVGGVLASFKLRDVVKLDLRHAAKGVPYAIIAFFGFGISFFLLGVMVSELSWFIPVFLVKTLVVVFAGAYVGIKKVDLSFPSQVVLPVIAAGILEVTAFFAYGIGVSLNFNAVIAPLVSAVPMVTLTLARIFFKEHLENNQIIGVLSIFAGLVLLSI